MLNNFNKLMTPPYFDDEELRSSASNLNTIFILITTLGILGIVISNTIGLIRGTADFLNPVNIAIVALGIITIVLRSFLFRGYVRPVAFIFVGLVLVFAIFIIRTQNTITNTLTLQIIIPIALATYLLGRYVGLGILIIIGAALLWISSQAASGALGSPAATTPFNQWLILIITAAIIYGIDNLFRSNLVKALRSAKDSEKAQLEANLELKELQKSLEQRVEERTRALKNRSDQLEAIADVARSVATLQEVNQLLSVITTLVSERFGFYHVGIFLLDANRQYANLRAANSEGGKKMLARSHRLKVGEQGIVGFVTSQGQARVALDVGEEAVFFNNPDLPDTHSEVALPLKFGQQIIGALDIQSKDTNAFSQDDVNIFSVLADQVSVAIQNTRSLEQAQRAANEAEIASSQLTGQAWKGYAEKTQTRGYRYDGIKPELLNNLEQPTEDKDDLLSPVRLRGQTIGRLKLKASDANHKWTEDERAIIASTAERVALAMESARLLGEAQKRAARESLLAEIGTKLGASFQLDSILRDTVEELGQTLQGSTVSFQLINPSAPPTADTPKTDGASARRKKAE